jgi:hypothetical protein
MMVSGADRMASISSRSRSISDVGRGFGLGFGRGSRGGHRVMSSDIAHLFSVARDLGHFILTPWPLAVGELDSCM